MILRHVPVAQGIFHDVRPMTVLATDKGPPLSPMHVPSPSRVKVQIVLSNIRAALMALNRDRQSAVVSVVSIINCKLPGNVPGCEVCPHPDAIAFMPPPTNDELSCAAETNDVIDTSVVVWTTDISLARVSAL